MIAGAQAPVRRAFLLAVKKAFNAQGIESTFPQITLRSAPRPAAPEAAGGGNAPG